MSKGKRKRSRPEAKPFREERREVDVARPEGGTPRVWWERLRHALTTEPWATPLAVFAGSRLALFALVALFIGLSPIAPDNKPGFLGAFAKWDGGWYTSIAGGGYVWNGPAVQSNVAFFPLYPLLGKLVGLFLGSPERGLFLVANISFAIYLYYLYRLALLDFDQGTAYRAILYVAIFPLSFIYSCLYTESTMLALAVASLYYARQEKWPVAILLAALTALTRLSGALLLLPLAYEFYRQRGLRPQALALAAIPAATAGYALYIWWLSGSPLSFLTISSAAWERHFTLPWDTLRIGLQVVTRTPLTQYVTAIAIVDLATIVLFLALSFLAIRWLRASHWLYAIPASLFAISSTLDPRAGLPTASLARYLLAVFPAFLLLGLAGKNRYLHQTIAFTFAILWGILAIYFFSGIWVC